MKRSIKKITAFSLAAVMTIGSAFASFASNNNDNGSMNGGGNVNELNPSTIEYVSRTFVFHVNQGFRMYVMNGEGTVVSNTVDVVHYRPQFSQSLDNAEFAWARKDAEEWLYDHIGFTNKSKDATKNVDKTDIYGGPETLLFIGGGKADDKACPLVRTDLMNVNSSEVLMAPTGDGNYTQAKMYTYKELEDRITAYISSAYGTGALPRNGETDEKMPIKFYDPLSDQYGSQAGMNATGDYMHELMMSTFREEDGYDGSSLIQFLLRMEDVPVIYSDGKATGETEPLLQLTETNLKTKLAQLEASGSKDPLLDLLKTEELYVGFEPIHWCAPCIEFNINGTRERWDPPYIVYGTGSNAFWYTTKMFATFILENQDKYHLSSIPGFSKGSFDGQIGDMNDPAAFSDWLTSIEVVPYPIEFDWAKADEVYMLDHDESGLGMKVYDPATEKHFKTFLTGYTDKGYSIMIFQAGVTDPGTPTWDKKLFPAENYKPGPSPENTYPDKPNGPYPEEYPSEGEPYKVPDVTGTPKDHNFHILKFYAEKNPDGTYNYLENYTRDQTVHTVTMDDEPDYKVDNYFTSPTYERPNPTNGESSASYDDFKARLPKGEFEGDKAGRIEVGASSADTALYLRLVKVPMLTVEKFFPDGSTTVEVIPWQPNYDPTEPGYEYESDKQETITPDPLPQTWPETTGTPENDPNINVGLTTRTLYIKYKGGPEAVGPASSGNVITLEQNELAHTYTLEDLHAPITVQHKFADMSSMEQEGTGEHGHMEDVYVDDSYQNDEGEWIDDGYWDEEWVHDFDCHWHTFMSDTEYSYKLENPNDYGSTSFVGSEGPFAPVETGEVEDQGSFGFAGGTTEGVTPNLKFSIYRDKNKDQVTLYPEKNESVKSDLSHIGITQEGYEPKTTRVLDKGSTQWYSTFKTDYGYTKFDNTLGWDVEGCPTGEHQPGADTWDADELEPTLEELNMAYSESNNVLTKAFYGQPGKGDKNTELGKAAFTLDGLSHVPSTATFGASGHNATQLFEASNKAEDQDFFALYPYIEYEYETVENAPAHTDAFVTSTNLSEIKDNTSIEMGTYYSMNGAENRYGIGLNSEQWSTHARTLEGLGNSGVAARERNTSLLPGGATVDLKTANTDSSLPEVWIGLRTYQTTMPDDLQKTYTQETQDNDDKLKTTSEAKADALTFIEDLKKILSGYQLEKWVKEGIYTDESALDSGATKVSGINASNTFAGSSLNRTDSKYYLKDSASADAPDSSHIDVVRSEQAQHVYKVASDTKGTVTVYKDGSEIASQKVTDKNSISGLLSNPDVKRVDDRVKFVTNFVQSLDFDQGSDRTGAHWYNDAHDGFEVVETVAALQIGFGAADGTGSGGGAPVRSEVVDPRLTGKLDSKSDILNFNPETITDKARTLQYRTSDHSTAAEAAGKPDGYMGTFDGIDIVMPNTNTLLRTKLHYLSNTTVQDLN